MLARSGISLPVSTMADMVGRAGTALAPLAEALHRMLLTRDVVHADAPPLQLLDTRKGGKSRAGYARPILKKLWKWLEQQKNACPENSALGRAIAYALKRRVALCLFLEDGALPLDNNVCERAIKPVVMGRKSWLFAGSVAAGERAAKIMNLLETAKKNGLEPHAFCSACRAGQKRV